jgi:hypothetical protein
VEVRFIALGDSRKWPLVMKKMVRRGAATAGGGQQG